MILCINDCAYGGQFNNIIEAKKVLLSHAINIQSSKKITGEKTIYRTAELKNRLITKDKTIVDMFYDLRNGDIPEDRSLVSFLLLSFIKGPYISCPEEKCDIILNETKANGSALHYCSENTITRGVISPDIDEFRNDSITIYKKHAISVNNFYSIDQIKEAEWVYEANPKHIIPHDIIVNGNVWSKMPLDDDLAQKVLSSSIRIKGRRCTFALHNKQWYQFYNHDKNLFHGFPIVDNGNDQHLNKVSSFMRNNEAELHGQITIE